MLARLLPDRFVLLLIVTIGVASLLTVRGFAVPIVSALANIAIFSLFFFHGLRIAHDAVWAGLRHWRLQLAVLVSGFLGFRNADFVSPFFSCFFSRCFLLFLNKSKTKQRHIHIYIYMYVCIYIYIYK